MPTLVLQSPDGTSTFPAALGRYLVDHIEGARCVDVPELWDSDEAVDAVEEFLTGLPGGIVSSTDRVLATVLFTDIVGSTDRAGQLGDAAWRRLLDAHDDLVRAELARYGGREVDTTGDGFFATFDGPARALRCAAAIVEAVRTIGLEIRAGVHTGEVTRRGDGYAGMGVHIGARVMAVAGASEVVTTSTVRDLVIGSGLEFDDRGVHTLKGVDGLVAAADTSHVTSPACPRSSSTASPTRPRCGTRCSPSSRATTSSRCDCPASVPRCPTGSGRRRRSTSSGSRRSCATSASRSTSSGTTGARCWPSASR